MRGNRRQRIFVDDNDRLLFLGEVDAAAQHYRWVPLAYCLMTNHCHLVIETPVMTLGQGMCRLAGDYAQRFNGRHGHDGHLFQGRYGSKLVDSDVYFAQLLRYVALNPVSAGLCDDPAAWRWSSHRSMLTGSSERVEELLEAWGGQEGTRYRRLFDPGGSLATTFGDSSPWTYRPSLEDLLGGSSRDEGIRAARRHGYRLAEIADVLGVHESTVSRRLQRAPERK